MRAGGRDREAGAFGGGDQFAAGADDLVAQLGDVLADVRADLDDRLVHLAA